jgi:hypothetical protein
MVDDDNKFTMFSENECIEPASAWELRQTWLNLVGVYIFNYHIDLLCYCFTDMQYIAFNVSITEPTYH